jgi:hypothetical protein
MSVTSPSIEKEEGELLREATEGVVNVARSRSTATAEQAHLEFPTQAGRGPDKAESGASSCHPARLRERHTEVCTCKSDTLVTTLGPARQVSVFAYQENCQIGHSSRNTALSLLPVHTSVHKASSRVALLASLEDHITGKRRKQD